MKGYILMWSICLVLLITAVSHAGTLDDIKTNVQSNASAISDIQATADIAYTDSETYTGVPDFSGFNNADYYAKGITKFRCDGTGADTRAIRCNGTTVWWIDDGWVSESYSTYKQRAANDKYIMDLYSVIEDNTWTLDESTYTISGVECYRITSTDYDMYVDTATKTKTYKVVKNTGGITNYVMFSGYSYLESTAYVANTITHYWDVSSMTMTLSSIDINESLADSLFEVQ